MTNLELAVCLITTVNGISVTVLMLFRNNVEAALSEVNGKRRSLVQHGRRTKQTF